MPVYYQWTVGKQQAKQNLDQFKSCEFQEVYVLERLVQ